MKNDKTSYTNNKNIHESGARFNVICLRCNTKFTVIRNWGGGVRNASNENINPAKCPSCDSKKLEIF